MITSHHLVEGSNVIEEENTGTLNNFIMMKLIKDQKDFFHTNGTKELSFRIEQLTKLKTVITNNYDLVEKAVFMDYGKSKFETHLGELSIVMEEIELAILNLHEWAAHKPKKSHVINMPGKSYVVPEPLGVSLIIGPWNYPFQLTLAPAVGALAAGCTVILKPSELTPHTSRLLSDLISANFEEKYFAVVEGGVAETTALLQEKFDIIFFTGSVPVGRIVYEAAAKNLTPVVLELGGKSPAIFMDDSELEISVRRMVWSKFFNSGQTCIAPDYIYVHESIEEQFLIQVAKEITAADYQLENENYVKMINVKNADRVSKLIDAEKVYIGGKFDVEARFVEPTVMRGVTWDDAVMREEVFGPVLPVLTFSDIDEVILEIKSRAKPLALYLFTQTEAIKDKVVNEISFGGGCINEALMHVMNSDMAFGGVGDSGIGGYHGEHGFLSFSHLKGMLEKELVPDPDVKYSPVTAAKLDLLHSVVSM